MDVSTKIPRISLNPREHKIPIAIAASVLAITSGILPFVGYLTLHYTSSLDTKWVLTIFTTIFGVISLFSLITRTVRLARSSSTCRPLGATSAWTLDYFNWNFAGDFCILCVIISVGISRPPPDVNVVSLSLPLLMIQICGQMVAFIPLRAMRVRAPCRISSYGKGELLKPACFTIAEDVMAVDAQQGDTYRAAFAARYDASPLFRQLIERMDYLWGFTGTILGFGLVAIIFAVPNNSIGWALGESFMIHYCSFHDRI